MVAAITTYNNLQGKVNAQANASYTWHKVLYQLVQGFKFEF